MPARAPGKLEQPILLALVALPAEECYGVPATVRPAGRAARVDPMASMRAEG